MFESHFWKMNFQNCWLLCRRFLKLLLSERNIAQKNSDFGAKSGNSALASRILLRCISSCQKWIPGKIPHRYGAPTFFSTFIFSSQKIFLKKKSDILKIFKKSDFHWESYFSNENHFFSKNENFQNFTFFSSKLFFLDEKIKVEKKIGTSFRCGILSGIHFWHP